MKKFLIGILILCFICSGSVVASYLIAKEKADMVAKSFPGNLSPMSAQLALFGAPELTPCWVFRAEYYDLMTGATFDVYISLLGKVTKVPPYSKVK